MDYVEFRSFDNYREAYMVLDRLRSQRINCHLEDQSAPTRNPLREPAAGGLKLMVHHSQVERVWDMIESAEQDYLKKVRCPVCKLHTLEIVSITKNHACRLAALASMVLNGHPVEVTKMYRCSHCGYDFKEIPEGR